MVKEGKPHAVSVPTTPPRHMTGLGLTHTHVHMRTYTCVSTSTHTHARQFTTEQNNSLPWREENLFKKNGLMSLLSDCHFYLLTFQIADICLTIASVCHLASLCGFIPCKHCSLYFRWDLNHSALHLRSLSTHTHTRLNAGGGGGR